MECNKTTCDRDQLDGRPHCIYHQSGRTEQELDQFYSIIEKQIAEGNHNFKTYRFPRSYKIFEKPMTLKNADFENAYFAKDAVFNSDVKFTGNTNFDRTNFNEQVIFFGKLSGNINITQCICKGNISFAQTIIDGANIVFKGNEPYVDERPYKDISMLACKISNKSSIQFEQTKTNKLSISDNTIENSSIHLDRINIILDTHIGSNTFSDSSLKFSNTKFNGNRFLYEDDNRFDNKSSLVYYNCKFNAEESIFNDVNFNCKTDFERCFFNGDTDFRGTSGLDQCLFKLSSIENINFDGVTWKSEGRIRDETRIPSELEQPVSTDLVRNEYISAADSYRKLKYNYESKRDYHRGSMFYIREKECIRNARGFFHKIGLLTLKYSCNYGESLMRVIGTAIISIIIFSYLFLFLGIDHGERTINYDLTSDFNIPSFDDIKLSLIVSYKFFFIPFRDLMSPLPHDGISTLIANLESIWGSFMIGLFVFVFRRYMRK